MTDYAKKFAAAKKAAGPRNDLYEPYNKNGSWWFDTPAVGVIGPFVSEQLCQKRANYFKERDGE